MLIVNATLPHHSNHAFMTKTSSSTTSETGICCAGVLRTATTTTTARSTVESSDEIHPKTLLHLVDYDHSCWQLKECVHSLSSQRREHRTKKLIPCDSSHVYLQTAATTSLNRCLWSSAYVPPACHYRSQHRRHVSFFTLGSLYFCHGTVISSWLIVLLMLLQCLTHILCHQQPTHTSNSEKYQRPHNYFGSIRERFANSSVVNGAWTSTRDLYAATYSSTLLYSPSSLAFQLSRQQAAGDLHPNMRHRRSKHMLPSYQTIISGASRTGRPTLRHKRSYTSQIPSVSVLNESAIATVCNQDSPCDRLKTLLLNRINLAVCDLFEVMLVLPANTDPLHPYNTTSAFDTCQLTAHEHSLYTNLTGRADDLLQNSFLWWRKLLWPLISTSSQCVKSIATLHDKDKALGVTIAEFDDFIQHQKCSEEYDGASAIDLSLPLSSLNSKNQSCDRCKKAYKYWYCSLHFNVTLPTPNDLAEQVSSLDTDQGRATLPPSLYVPPSSAWCADVEAKCPYFPPLEKEENGGEPAFLCDECHYFMHTSRPNSGACGVPIPCQYTPEHTIAGSISDLFLRCFRYLAPEYSHSSPTPSLAPSTLTSTDETSDMNMTIHDVTSQATRPRDLLFWHLWPSVRHTLTQVSSMSPFSSTHWWITSFNVLWRFFFAALVVLLLLRSHTLIVSLRWRYLVSLVNPLPLLLPVLVLLLLTLVVSSSTGIFWHLWASTVCSSASIRLILWLACAYVWPHLIQMTIA